MAILFQGPSNSSSPMCSVHLKIYSPPWIRAPQILIQWILAQYSSCICIRVFMYVCFYLYMYLYVCMYTYVYIYIYMSAYIIYIFKNVYIYLYLHMYTRISICTYAICTLKTYNSDTYWMMFFIINDCIWQRNKNHSAHIDEVGNREREKEIERKALLYIQHARNWLSFKRTHIYIYVFYVYVYIYTCISMCRYTCRSIPAITPMRLHRQMYLPAFA